ncbi:MAG TPA: CheR family methyltransferase [Geobacteraceae bacterium]|nr:CheR family methyltransferase [Geobacteraceae bacterium]
MQIFATDADEDAIAKARRGEYQEKIVEDVTEERLRRFFVRTDNSYRISKEIREMVVFARHHLITDTPFTRLDILCCRNLLIYMTAGQQNKLIPLFHYCLRPGGILFLGNSENIGTFSELFALVGKKGNIYRKIPVALAAGQIKLPALPQALVLQEPELRQLPVNLQSLADQVILERFAPAAVLVTAAGDILYVRGRTGKYLEPPAGKTNCNIFAMAREELRFDLELAFNRALELKGEMIQRSLALHTGPGVEKVDLIVFHIDKPASLNGKLMVLFRDNEATAINRARGKKDRVVDPVHVTELERLLRELREELQATTEDNQVSQEGFMVINEGLRLTNEGLQTGIDEMRIANQELQSTNMELATSNVELHSKIEEQRRENDKRMELSSAYSELNDLLNSSDIAMIFLDEEKRIRHFTAGSTKLFRLLAADIGRPLTDMVTDLVDNDLKQGIKEILRSEVTMEKTAATSDGRHFIVRITPCRTDGADIGGVVITFLERKGS